MTKSKEIYYKISELYKKGKYSEINKINELLDDNLKNDIEILNILGTSLIHEKSFYKAIEIFQKIKSINPKDNKVNINLGNLYRLTRQYELALKFFNDFAQSNQDSYQVYYNLALTYISIGKIDLAIENFDLSLKYLSSENKNLINQICEHYIGNLINLGLNDKAIETSNKLILKFPNSFILHWRLANLYTWSNKEDKAEKFYKKAINIEPQNEPLKFDFAVWCKKNGKNDDAIELFKSIKFGQSRALYIMTLFQLDRYDEFQDEILKACSNYKGNRLLANLNKYASYLFNQDDQYPFCKNPFDFIYTNNIGQEDLINNVLKKIDSMEINPTNQKLLKNGVQSSGNLFQLKSSSLNKLREIIMTEIELYKNQFSKKSEYFIENWPKDSTLKSWYINLKEGGTLDYHIHHDGWISGTVYLEVPKTDKEIEGSIQFGFNNVNYKFLKDLPTRTFKPKSSDIVIFPSSLSHRVNPFQETKNNDRRVSLAFDLIPI